MPRDYRDLLEDIASAALAIEQNIASLTYDQFVVDTNRVKAVLFDLAVIGEAVRNLSDEIREKRPEVEWSKIVGLRHFIAHVYWTIKIEKIRDIARADVSDLRKEVESLLEELQG